MISALPSLATATPPHGRGARLKRLADTAAAAAWLVLPPFVCLAALLLLWQLLTSGPDATLPPPTAVLSGSWELITDPF